MISRSRFLVTAAFVGHLLLVPPRLAGQLHCPPVAPSSKDAVTICAMRQEKHGPIFKLHVRSKIDYRDFTLWSDEATYNSDTGDVTLDGHVALDGGPNDEHIHASHGTYNLRSETGVFYDVTGTINSNLHPHGLLLTTSNRFAFSGKVVYKTGPDHYVVHDGVITTCDLAHPKWQFNTHRASVTAGDSATIYLATFRIRRIPVFYFPYATHPVERSQRKSGLLMPNVGRSSVKGYILGEGYYWAINRSLDTTIGAEYLSRRGWAQHGEFRARPNPFSYLDMTYFGVRDRGVGTPRVSQGGEEVRLNGVSRFPGDFRAVANIDYLSSFLFRLAFNPVFNQPLQSEVKSQGFLSKDSNGFSYNALIEHYQSFQSATRGDVITIAHAPSFDLSSLDREVGHSPFYWSLDTAVEGLSRNEPSFHTAPVVGRFDANPNVSLPLLFHGWSLRPEIGTHYTLYSQQLQPSSGLGTASSDPINRRALATSVELRPPALERLFDHKLFGLKLKHVIEPSVVYRDVSGVNDFSKILRFDERDILSNTNEVEYRVINRLYAKKSVPQSGNCKTPDLPSLNPQSASQPGLPPWEDDDQPRAKLTRDSKEPSRDNCPAASSSARELISWELAQKYFLDTSFGGALVNGQRNVFTTTADLTAFAFLSSPRHLSPLISRLRIQPSSNLDAEWDLDYDFMSGRMNAGTGLLSYHVGQLNFAVADAYEYFSGGQLVVSNTIGPLRYHQFRTLAQYGNSSKRGLSGAGAFIFDVQSGVLQVSAFQSTYNWDCCGITAEYARVKIGSIRNENVYRFSYNLANIGSFGNLLRKERLY